MNEGVEFKVSVDPYGKVTVNYPANITPEFIGVIEKAIVAIHGEPVGIRHCTMDQKNRVRVPMELMERAGIQPEGRVCAYYDKSVDGVVLKHLKS